jgi:hypothetical protein
VSTSSNIIAPGVISGANISTQVLSEVRIPVTHERVDQLYEAKYLRVRVVFNTSNYPEKIKIYDDQKINVSLVADFEYNVQVQ